MDRTHCDVEQDPFNAAVQQALSGRISSSKRPTPDAPQPDSAIRTPALLTSRPENMYTPYAPLLLRIEYELKNLRDGFTFVGCEPGDMRYPHAYTTNTPSPGAACCLFPTLDGIHERWTWELEITVPRTIGDIDKIAAAVATPVGRKNGEDVPMTNGINGTHSETRDEAETASVDEDSDLDMVVVCSGDNGDEVMLLALV